jgi:hypothetical protein
MKKAASKGRPFFLAPNQAKLSKQSLLPDIVFNRMAQEKYSPTLVSLPDVRAGGRSLTKTPFLLILAQ